MTEYTLALEILLGFLAWITWPWLLAWITASVAFAVLWAVGLHRIVELPEDDQ